VALNYLKSMVRADLSFQIVTSKNYIFN
jgi:hypothetical protein